VSEEQPVQEIADRVNDLYRQPEQNYLMLMDPARERYAWQSDTKRVKIITSNRRTRDYRSKHC